jgi:hypothetical protein
MTQTENKRKEKSLKEMKKKKKSNWRVVGG